MVTQKQKWEKEIEFREREIAIKEHELKIRIDELRQSKETRAKSGWRSPLILAIAGASLAAIGNATISYFESTWDRQLEVEKAEHNRVLEMIKTNDPDRNAINLKFLVDANLIANPNLLQRLNAFLKDRTPGEGPALGTSSVLDSVTKMSQLRRNAVFNRKLEDSDDQSIVASVGDSWFQYPMILTEIVDHLTNEFNVFSLDKPGAKTHELLTTNAVTQIYKSGAKTVILSVGLFDLFGEELIIDNETLSENFEKEVFQITKIITEFSKELLKMNPEVKIYIHGYDYFPYPVSGKYHKYFVEDNGLNKRKFDLIIKKAVDTYNDKLAKIASENKALFYVDLRGTANSPEDWFNHLHPNNSKFAIMSNKLSDAIRRNTN